MSTLTPSACRPKPRLIHHRGGSLAKLRLFLTASTCLLYLVAAGLVARSVWYFEAQHWKILVGGDAAEMGTGAGSYDIDRSVWHVNVSPGPARSLFDTPFR